MADLDLSCAGAALGSSSGWEVAPILQAAEQAASGVDREGRFPSESFDALRVHSLMSAPLSAAKGGGGASVAEISALTRELGRVCGSTGLIYAMHAGQVICLDRHSSGADGSVSDALSTVIDRLATEQLLIASSTTEAGIGGDVRRSSCHVDRHDDRIRLDKLAPVISYADDADVVLITARRDVDAASSDQVLVACPASDIRMSRISTWDTMGFRGTCSVGYRLSAETAAGHVLPVAYSDISSRTMLPLSHLLWASAWLGIADAARDIARRVVQEGARRKRGDANSPAALRLAELTLSWRQLVASVADGVALVERAAAEPAVAERAGFALAANTLKVSGARLVSDIALSALRIVGIDGYRRDHDLSLDRIVRDALGATLMVNDDRILANNAGLVLMDREGL